MHLTCNKCGSYVPEGGSSSTLCSSCFLQEYSFPKPPMTRACYICEKQFALDDLYVTTRDRIKVDICKPCSLKTANQPDKTEVCYLCKQRFNITQLHVLTVVGVYADVCTTCRNAVYSAKAKAKKEAVKDKFPKTPTTDPSPNHPFIIAYTKVNEALGNGQLTVDEATTVKGMIHEFVRVFEGNQTWAGASHYLSTKSSIVQNFMHDLCPTFPGCPTPTAINFPSQETWQKFAPLTKPPYKEIDIETLEPVSRKFRIK